MADSCCALTAAASPGQAAACGGSLLDGRLLPQIKRHVALTLLAARERLENAGDYYRPFHLFGYDFLVDADFVPLESAADLNTASDSSSPYKPMEDSTRRMLEAFFEPHNQELYAYLEEAGVRVYGDKKTNFL